MSVHRQGDLVVPKPLSPECGYTAEEVGRVGRVAATRNPDKRVKVRFGGNGPDGVTRYVRAEDLEEFRR